MESARKGNGGGFFCDECGDVFITKSSFVDLTGKNGGGMYLLDSKNVFI